MYLSPFAAQPGLSPQQYQQMFLQQMAAARPQGGPMPMQVPQAQAPTNLSAPAAGMGGMGAGMGAGMAGLGRGVGLLAQSLKPDMEKAGPKGIGGQMEGNIGLLGRIFGGPDGGAKAAMGQPMGQAGLLGGMPMFGGFY